MRYLDEKAEKTVWQLEKLTVKECTSLEGFHIKFCDYKKDNEIPEADESWEPLSSFLPLEGRDMYCWIRGRFQTPPARPGEYYALEFAQENKNCRIQVLLYLNGEMTQGLDVNHTRTFLEPDTEYDAAFYCYFDRISPYSALSPKLVTAVKTEGSEGALPAQASFVSCDRENIILETLKRSENGTGLILRLYDAYNTSATPVISFGFDVKRCWLCDLNEHKQTEAEVKNRSVCIPVQNFEIVTLLLEV